MHINRFQKDERLCFLSSLSGVGAQVYIPSTQASKSEGAQTQGQPGFHSESEASQGYTANLSQPYWIIHTQHW